jgi:hypothetical protein
LSILSLAMAGMLQTRSNSGAYAIGRHEAPERGEADTSDLRFHRTSSRRCARKASAAMVRHLNNIRKALTDASNAKAMERSPGIAKGTPGDL